VPIFAAVNICNFKLVDMKTIKERWPLGGPLFRHIWRTCPHICSSIYLQLLTGGYENNKIKMAFGRSTAQTHMADLILIFLAVDICNF
jgi:hypothetical protein